MREPMDRPGRRRQLWRSSRRGRHSLLVIRIKLGMDPPDPAGQRHNQKHPVGMQPDRSLRRSTVPVHLYGRALSLRSWARRYPKLCCLATSTSARMLLSGNGLPSNLTSMISGPGYASRHTRPASPLQMSLGKLLPRAMRRVRPASD
jgi:hypothetical protein